MFWLYTTQKLIIQIVGHVKVQGIGLRYSFIELSCYNETWPYSDIGSQ